MQFKKVKKKKKTEFFLNTNNFFKKWPSEAEK